MINTNTLERLQHAEDLYVLQPYLPQKARLIVRPESGDFHTIYPESHAPSPSTQYYVALSAGGICGCLALGTCTIMPTETPEAFALDIIVA